MQINPDCKTCQGTGVQETRAHGIIGRGACLDCQMVERLATKGSTDFVVVRHALMERPATLDGKPAKVSGALCDFAHVYPIGEPVEGIPFAWETVRHVVMDRGGAFRS